MAQPLIYRHKTRSDEVINPSDLRHGQTVWLQGPNGREEYIHDGPSNMRLSRAHFLLAQKQHAIARAAQHKRLPRRDRSSAFTH